LCKFRRCIERIVRGGAPEGLGGNLYWKKGNVLKGGQARGKVFVAMNDHYRTVEGARLLDACFLRGWRGHYNNL